MDKLSSNHLRTAVNAATDLAGEAKGNEITDLKMDLFLAAFQLETAGCNV
jgi:hypothetical protein